MHNNISLFKFKPGTTLRDRVRKIVRQSVPTPRLIEDIGREKDAITQATHRAADSHKMSELIKKSNRPIASISSMFPWDLFPNSIDVEESRITFVFRQFMASQSHSLDIKDISNIFIESSLFFSTLQIVSRTFVQNDIKISHLNKSKAHDIRNIIEGLRTINESKIDTSKYGVDELLAQINELHTTETVAS